MIIDFCPGLRRRRASEYFMKSFPKLLFFNTHHHHWHRHTYLYYGSDCDANPCRLGKVVAPASASVFDKSKLERNEKDAWAIAFAQLEPLDVLVRSNSLPYPADQSKSSYPAELCTAVLNQSDSGRSAAVKRALESLRLLVISTQEFLSSNCFQSVVKRLIKICAGKMALIPDYASEALFDIVSNTVDIAVFAALADSVDLSKADMCKHIAQATKLAVCRESFNESSFKSKKIAEHLIVLILALRGSNNAVIKLKIKEIVETLNTKASTFSLCSEFLEIVKQCHDRSAFVSFLDLCQAESASALRVAGEDICRKASIPIASTRPQSAPSRRSVQTPKTPRAAMHHMSVLKEDLDVSTIEGVEPTSPVPNKSTAATPRRALTRAQTSTPLGSASIVQSSPLPPLSRPRTALPRQTPRGPALVVVATPDKQNTPSKRALDAVTLDFDSENVPPPSSSNQLPTSEFLSPSTPNKAREKAISAWTDRLTVGNSAGKAAASASITSPFSVSRRTASFIDLTSLMSPTPICDPDEATSTENELLKKLLEMPSVVDLTSTSTQYSVSDESVRAREQRRAAILSAGFALDKAITVARNKYDAISMPDVLSVVSEMKTIRNQL